MAGNASSLVLPSLAHVPPGEQHAIRSSLSLHPAAHAPKPIIDLVLRSSLPLPFYSTNALKPPPPQPFISHPYPPTVQLPSPHPTKRTSLLSITLSALLPPQRLRPSHHPPSLSLSLKKKTAPLLFGIYTSQRTLTSSRSHTTPYTVNY